MEVEEDFIEVLELTVERVGNLCTNIGELQLLTGGDRNFKDVLSSYKAMPDWSSEEAMKFRNMLELIKDACNSFDELVDAARAYVLRTKEFAKENIDFMTDVQDDMDAEDVEGLLADWIESIGDMKECNDKIATMKGQFRKVLDKLEKAKGQAASGKNSGKRNAEESGKSSRICTVAGAALTFAGGVATVAAAGGFAVAFPVAVTTLAFGGWSFETAIKSAAVSIKEYYIGPDTTSDDSSIQGKYKEWEKAFALTASQLDEAYAYVGNKIDENKNVLTDLSEYSRQLLSISKKMAKAEKIARIQQSGRVRKQFKRLEGESQKVKTACIEYIKKDNDTRGITGTMARLSLE